MNVISSERIPIKVWSDLNKVETVAIQQLKNVANLPFVFKHVAVMPDVHFGKGATVGSVIATKNAVIPAAVGVDIGCGMMAVKLDIEPNRVTDKAKEIRQSIEALVPVGFNRNNVLSETVEDWIGWTNVQNLHAIYNHTKASTELIKTAYYQLGSLGGGNHFIELCTDLDGKIWIMLHSGSRNIGKSLAELHIRRAKDEMKKMFISLPDPDLAYYVRGTKQFDDYMTDLIWAQEYAKENRKEMMRRVLGAVSTSIGEDALTIDLEVNCHHNYCEIESHYGENVLLTRKGAVRARKGDLGIIPGSMGAKSFIVEGLGNPESFHSCSHGAGRKMSRTKARATFTVADLESQTIGVECRKDEDVIDEIPSAYKDIDEVMSDQRDLVKVIAQLKQFICIKG